MKAPLFIALIVAIFVSGCIFQGEAPSIHGNLSHIIVYEMTNNNSVPTIERNISYPLLFPDFIWNHTNFTVYIDDSTNKDIPWFRPEINDQVFLAFQMWENATDGLISFTPVSSAVGADVVLTWKRYFESNDSSVQIGEAEPLVYSVGLANLSVHSEISQVPYRNPCVARTIAAHELGHILGLGHSTKQTSIMYPYVYCISNITQKEISAIKSMYSNLSAYSDIMVKNASLKRIGNYLNGSMIIKNNGIFTSPYLPMDIIVNNNMIYTYNLSPLEPGHEVTTTFSNVYINVSSDNILLKIGGPDKLIEIDYLNNVAVMKALENLK